MIVDCFLRSSRIRASWSYEVVTFGKSDKSDGEEAAFERQQDLMPVWRSRSNWWIICWVGWVWEDEPDECLRRWRTNNGSAAGSDFQMARNRIATTIARMIERGKNLEAPFATFHYVDAVNTLPLYVFAIMNLVIIVRMISPCFLQNERYE